MWSFLYTLASPKRFYHLSKAFANMAYALSFIAFCLGVSWALFIAPPDYQQGDAFRIIYLHVPAAFLSLFIYGFMSFLSVLILVWQIKLAGLVLKNAAGLGAMMTLLALITGSIWGKPMWGTWWIWDARLTSELVLLFIYLGILALHNAIAQSDRAIKAMAMMTLVGLVDIPIIHYSVYWWHTLHQGATISAMAKPKIAPSMLYPLLVMIVAFMSYFFGVLLSRTRDELLYKERQSRWAKQIMKAWTT